MNAPFYTSVESFVNSNGGNHAITKILIANNGIGAIKAIRSIRRWSFEVFGHEKKIKFVAMATPEDLRANAEYIRMADEVVDVPGGSNNNNYANINLICEIVERLEVDAVMPLWGHASENPSLPDSLGKLNRKVSFIGPPATPMQALGDKIGSTIIAQSAGVPTIDWNGSDLVVDYKSTGISTELYEKANIKTPEDALKHAIRIGFPVMIKASEGGGGKGIRKALSAEEVPSLFRQVQGEIPGSPIFIMKMASKSRHLEVQILADQYGQVIALSGRDCSVQRRHQKIIEEGPPIAASPKVFKKMEQAAVALAKTVGYINAGTVEYLFLEEKEEFAFLELNPRLQVEHPVTENILGINLPACQLQVAMGIPLHRIGDIRKMYGRHERGNDTIDFDFSERLPFNRHCIAVRVTAENPDIGFQPTSGKIHELHFRSSIDVWGYFSVDDSGSIHEFADSQFGHIFASGSNRENARRAMICALKELQIRGEIRTTIEYIIELLQSNDFVENQIDTTWLDHRISNHEEIAKSAKSILDPRLVILCGCAVKAHQFFEMKKTEFIDLLRVGQIPSKYALSQSVPIDLIHKNIKYKSSCVLATQGSMLIYCNDHAETVSVRQLPDNGFLLKINGLSHMVYTLESGKAGSFRMFLDGQTCVFTPEYDPTKLVSSVAGKIARLLVQNGAHLNSGDAFVEIEVMKMYMPLKVTESGFINFQMSDGAILSPGDLIATMILDDPDKVVKSEDFKGILSLNETDKSFQSVLEIESLRPHVLLREALSKLVGVLDGFVLSENDTEKALISYMSAIKHNLLAYYEVEENMSILKGRVDSEMSLLIHDININYKESIKSGHIIEYPAEKVLKILLDYSQNCPSDKKAAFSNLISPVWNTVEKFLYPYDIRLIAGLQKLIEVYLSTESLFDNMSFTDVVSGLRKDHQNNLDQVFALCRSHVNINAKNKLLILILEEIKRIKPPSVQLRPKLSYNIPIKSEINVRYLKKLLTDLSTLKQQNYSHVALSASLLLMEQYSLTIDQRRQKLTDVITSALLIGDQVGLPDRTLHLKKFAESNIAIRDLLLESLRHDRDYKIAFIEMYLRKIYQKTHNLTNMTSGYSISDDNSADNFVWLKFEFMTRGVDAVSHNSDSSSIMSYSDLANLAKQKALNTIACSDSENEDENLLPREHMSNRTGIFAVFESQSDVVSNFSLVLDKISNGSKITPLKIGSVNVAYVTIMNTFASSDEETSIFLSSFLKSQIDLLNKHGIRRITFLVGQSDKKGNYGNVSNIPSIFNFKSNSNFTEDRLYRQIESTYAFHLDLTRLSNFQISLVDGLQTLSGNVHLYHAVPLNGNGLPRYFARLISFPIDQSGSDTESLFLEALDHLSLVLRKQSAKPKTEALSSNHIFLNIVAPDLIVQPDTYVSQLRNICTKYSQKLVNLVVANVEMKITCRLSNDLEPMYIRMVASNPTGFALNIDQYYETFSGGIPVFKSLNNQIGEWDGLPTSKPYDISYKFESKRAEAQAASDTLYVYDWPVLFEKAIKMSWESYIRERSRLSFELPDNIFECQELVLCKFNSSIPLEKGWKIDDVKNNPLVPMKRNPGLNDTGMVAWLIFYKSPECLEGRSIVLISNDITHQAGSFGTKEDLVFFKASEYARVLGIPRIYLAANSGARIGMAKSLQDKFHIAWLDESDPSRGFKYIYLNKSDYEKIISESKNNFDIPIICSELVENSEHRMVITDVIGIEPDLGVENLMGSGLIAGETARAYDEIFTLTLVVGRTVGIGAYLVRLGQRTIQRTSMSPIILTGYQALNKLMGREIYTTNDQLGGPMIMFPNGVSHLLAENHLESVCKALSWLSYIPSKKGGKLPIVDINGLDTIERNVMFTPPKGLPYDPRCLLNGALNSNDIWESGFLDKNSFIETLSGWAKTVIVGRGRIGGIPLGVIITENRTAEATKPADPADISSQEKMVQQAGGVWFPDSAYKTAQALRDFNREGLPCIIFANWRGFSGGQRDMFDEVLKFGSMIVDALVSYQQPLFVYIPPYAELRGGAWVVVDSTINPDVMEFYAAEEARGGVLEAAGAASIKFREKDIILASHRLDPVLISLDNDLKNNKSLYTVQDTEEINKKIKVREKLLFGVYQQVAIHFADLHDTPGRMKAKGVIRKQVNWSESRNFFYWRIRRMLTEFDVAKALKSLDSIKYSQKIASESIKNWYLSSGGSESDWEEDKLIFNWFQDHSNQLNNFIASIRNKSLISRLREDFNKLLSAASNFSDDDKSNDFTREILQHAFADFGVNEKEKIFKNFS